MANLQEQSEVVKMPRSHGIGKAWQKKKQKVSAYGKYDDASVIDSSNEQIDVNVISSLPDAFESEEKEEMIFDSTANICCIFKNSKVGSKSYHELFKGN
eukprot:8788929-Ditylum_brightwellii.AAC.1